jgi:hypothetical protein
MKKGGKIHLKKIVGAARLILLRDFVVICKILTAAKIQNLQFTKQ